MYVPKHFEEARPEALHALMRRHPLATVVTLGPQGLNANPIPLLWVEEEGVLRGHVARANPMWREAGAAALAIFNGPDAYVSPNWYPSKRENGKAVPTWNYACVHAHGRLRVIDDAGWLRSLLAELSDAHEAGQPEPWRLADAADDYIEKMLGAVVGIEIEIERLEGKWKVSQNQSQQNRAGVAAGLETSGELRMAALVREREGK